MATTIHYNGVNPMIGLNGSIGPTPFVARSENYIQAGERLIAQETLTLKGVITGVACEFGAYSQFNHLVSGATSPQLELLKNFSKDFQLFQIYDNNIKVFERDLVQITSINFPENNYGAIHTYLPFEVTMQTYPTIIGGRTFDGTKPWNVLQPVHELSFDRQEDATVVISERLSAQGLNLSANNNTALDNAKYWVDYYDCSTKSFPTLPSVANVQPCLKSSAETINRLAGTFERRNTYIYDSTNVAANYILRYSATYSYSEESGLSTVEINGTIDGCRNAKIVTDSSSLNAIRQAYANFARQALSTAMGIKSKFSDSPNLNPNATVKNINENTEKLKISFAFAFNDDLRPPISFDYKCTFNYDYENDVINATIEGDCTSRAYINAYSANDFPLANKNSGSNSKWSALSSFADNISLIGKLQNEYNNYLTSIHKNYGDYPLDPYPSSSGRTDNYFDWKINLTETYRSQPAILPPNFRKFDVTLNVNLSINQFKEFPCLDGKGIYNIFDLGYTTREICAIQVQGVLVPNKDQNAALSDVKKIVESIHLNNCGGKRTVLDSQQYVKTTSTSKVNVSASATFSTEGDVFLLDGGATADGNGVAGGNGNANGGGGMSF